MKRKNDFKVDYWQSMADVLSVIFLVVILLLMLITVDWVAEQEKNRQQEVVNVKPALPLPSMDDASNILSDTQTAKSKNSTSTASAGKGNYTEPPKETIPLEDDGQAAVRVIVIDGETKKPIKQKGISLQLYTSDGILETLNTYYPGRVSYSTFETVETGSFYLPEKIALGKYYFENTTAPAGYGVGDNISFELDKAYYWDKPYVLRFPVYPETRAITIKAKDSDTGEVVSGGKYDIIARKDIITLDGTVRANEGDCVDTVSCDNNGIAETKKLYIGNYEIQERTPPETYASLEEPIDIDMDKKNSGKEPEQSDIMCQKTKVIVNVQDELKESMSAEGAVYVLRKENGEQIKEYHVESSGGFEVTGLEKDTNYYLTQIKWGENYKQTKDKINFYVDSAGHIDGIAVKNMTLYNRKIRVKIEAKEMFLRSNISDYALILKDEDGNVVKKINTTATPIEIEGIEPGVYYLFSADGKGKKIQVQDDKEIQSFEYSIWTIKSTISCIVLFIVIIVSFVVVMRNRRKKEKH